VFEDAVGGAAGVPAAVPEHPGDQQEVLASRHRGFHGGRLAGQPDEAPDLLRVPHDVDAGDRQRAGVRSQQGREHPHGRRLARTVGAEDGEHLTGRRDDIEARQGVDLAEAFAQADGEPLSPSTQAIKTSWTPRRCRSLRTASQKLRALGLLPPDAEHLALDVTVDATARGSRRDS